MTPEEYAKFRQAGEVQIAQSMIKQLVAVQHATHQQYVQMQMLAAQQNARQYGGAYYAAPYVNMPAHYPSQPNFALPPPKLEDAGMRVGEIIGYRVWPIGPDGYLYSGAVDKMWAPGVPMSGDVASAGIHAFKTTGVHLHDAARGYSKGHGVAIGKVALYGEVVEHSLGYRAEYAMVESIDSVVGVPLGQRRKVIRELRAAYCPGTEGEDVPEADDAAETYYAKSSANSAPAPSSQTTRVDIVGPPEGEGHPLMILAPILGVMIIAIVWLALHSS
jgi:hypothetical protein